MKTKILNLFTLCLLLTISTHINAGLLAEKTRVIYQEGQRESALMINNTNDYPVLTQIWIDQGDGQPDTAKTPFLVLPPLFKLLAGETKGIRILQTDSNLPPDQESLFWLNLYEVPAVAAKKLDENYINLSMNTQMKVLYRPKTLKPFVIDEVQKQLDFKLLPDPTQHKIQIYNPTPYYISLASLKLQLPEKSIAYTEPENLLIAPKERKNVDFPSTTSSNSALHLHYVIIDDDGHHHTFQSKLGQ